MIETRGVHTHVSSAQGSFRHPQALVLMKSAASIQGYLRFESIAGRMYSCCKTAGGDGNYVVVKDIEKAVRDTEEAELGRGTWEDTEIGRGHDAYLSCVTVFST